MSSTLNTVDRRNEAMAYPNEHNGPRWPRSSPDHGPEERVPYLSAAALAPPRRSTFRVCEHEPAAWLIALLRAGAWCRAQPCSFLAWLCPGARSGHGGALQVQSSQGILVDSA